jgi:hypothetical protein
MHWLQTCCTWRLLGGGRQYVQLKNLASSAAADVTGFVVGKFQNLLSTKNKKEVSKDSEVPTFKKELYGMKYYCYQFFHKLPLLFAVGVLLCAPFSSAISPSFLGLLSFIFLICMFLNRQCFRIAHVSLSTNDTNAVSQSASFAAQSVNGIFNFFQGPASAAPTPWVVNVENCLLSDESIRGIFKRIG